MTGNARGSGRWPEPERLTDEELHRLILQAYEDSADLTQLQLSMQAVMLADPERIRQAYKRVVQLKGGARGRSVSEQQQQQPPPPRPSLILMDAGSQQRKSQRRRSNPAQQRGGHRKSGSSSDAAALSALMDASAFKEVAGSLETLRSELAALCRVRHENLLCLTGARPGKAGRFTLEFDLASASHVTLLELFREAGAEGQPLNGCEIACVLAQACLGLLFLTDCAAVTVLRNVRLRPEACLLTRNILLTSSGLIKLCGHHQALQLPRSSMLSRAVPTRSILEEGAEDELDDEFLESEPDSARGRPGQLAHRLAQLLYELDHTEHRPLRCLTDCSRAERELLDQRYAQLFGLCSDWDATKPLDLRCVLHSNFINEQTSSINSYQMPLELVFATRSC
ncbi:hypothetical protein BOX15_Mlig014960g2 [Macrostomum lignano]|uniref:Protein kinase domain-containing protein n=2 Tax=Macrostomum lignano TaxID=282301 RepID=A0A267FLS6_9PLAT|nr:hypothetical protein BOX15_Mlig014960g2 [Macrostomum lignano]